MTERSLNSAPARSGGREAFLAIILALFVGGGALVFLIFVSGGFFAWVILIGVGLGLFSALHYVLWGRSFSVAVAGEREELEAADESATNRARPTPHPWERRF